MVGVEVCRTYVQADASAFLHRALAPRSGGQLNVNAGPRDTQSVLSSADGSRESNFVMGRPGAPQQMGFEGFIATPVLALPPS
jgi:hypothetical protein